MATTLTQISPTAWEHAADRAALNSLRALPGFDDAVRKVFGFFGERGIRHFFLANAVRVGPNQRPQLDAMYTEVLQTLDWPGGGPEVIASRAGRPELYVTQTPIVNAAAVGFERPFIIINSGMLELLEPDEVRFILTHELGHIMSGHVVYRTIAIILMTVGIQNLPLMAGLAIMPFQIALMEWYRKSELSADRAGMLGVQDLRTSMSVFLKMAGGRKYTDTIDVDEFMVQASEYETTGGAWDSILKLLNTLFRDHPFGTVRAAELQRWVQSGAYQRIIDGDYPRRDGSGAQPLQDDIADAAGYYGDQVRETLGQIGDTLTRAREAFNDAWSGDRSK